MAMDHQASRAPITQRGRAGCAAQRAALRAEGLRTRHHRLRPIRPAGFPSSGKGGTPPLPSHTRLSRHHTEQRGHARPPVASLGGRQASPLVPSAQAGVPVSGQGGKPPCPCTRSVDQRRRRAAIHGAAPPLRPPAALLHKAPFHKVPGSRCAKAPLGARHRFAPSRVYETGLMQSGLRSSQLCA